jgi:hypothetical protein
LDFGFICGLALFGIGYAICDTGGGMLFVELVRAEDKLEHSDRTDNKPELEFGYFGMPAVESAKGMMENTDCEAVVNALCGSLLWTMIVVGVGWSLAPSFFWTGEIWSSPLCGGWFRCRGTCCTEA